MRLSIIVKRICILLLFIGINSFAQSKIIKVWQGKIPGAINNSEVKESVINTGRGERVKDVTEPTITVYLPPEEKMNGTAVLICPGGGYIRLAMPPEGDSVAVRLNKLGVAAFVLKYRLPNDLIMEDKTAGPLMDAQEAMRVIRSHSEEWGIDPDKTGVMGFSAGGHLASTLSTHYNAHLYDSDNTSARPDFSVLVYPVISMREGITHEGSKHALLGETPSDSLVNYFSNELQVNENTPPAFLVHAADDQSVPVKNSIEYFSALNKYDIPAELHIYQKGGHGFGLASDRKNETESNWFDALTSWMEMSGLAR